MGIAPQHTSNTTNIWISQPQGCSNCYSDPEGRFSIITQDGDDAATFLHMNAYSAAMAFVEGKFAVHGDLFSAIRFFSNQPRNSLHALLFSLWARLEHLRIRLIANKQESAQSIQFHYDRSNDFYKLFLDSRMVYSSAYFSDPGRSLEEAQTEKLYRICRDLDLKPADRLLDIGCGWGGLINYAAEHFGVTAFGCTLSDQQLNFARDVVRNNNLAGRVRIEPLDYRDLTGCFNKIASVGMFEHVGPGRLAGYFNKAYALLEKGGLFLNRGVVRPRGVSDDPETLFLLKKVFPGSELVHLDDVVRQGECAGFNVIGLEDLRMHYALTCRAWVKNLQDHADTCRSLVGESTFRTWLLYLAASAVSFETGRTSAAQVVFAKR